MATLIICVSNIAKAQEEVDVLKGVEAQAEIFYGEAVKKRDEKKIFPRTFDGDSIRLVNSNDWTSGFFPGILWYLYEFTGKPVWKARAGEFTDLMAAEPANRNSHDVGFKVYNSFGNGYRLTADENYKKAIVEGAATLVSRFNPKVGCTRSWDFGKWQYPVIIDNMMNLEILFAATRITGDSIYYKVAVSHANTTMANHFRPDFSSYHVIDYDTITGRVIAWNTHQGYADRSAWARGQAWALYGFTMCYRETGNRAYLEQAEKIAAFLLNHPRLPKDRIPYWDFDVPGMEKEPRDASAAAIIASALYELQSFSASGKKYRMAADDIVNNLTTGYRSAAGSNKGFILEHSTGHKPANGEVDVPIIYADYYYLEALMRKKALNK